jgi:hypothetical protein
MLLNSAASAAAADVQQVDDLAKRHSHVLNTYSLLLNNVKIQRTSSPTLNITLTNSNETSSSLSSDDGHHDIISNSPLVELTFKLNDANKYVPRIAAVKDGMQHELWASEPLFKVN